MSKQLAAIVIGVLMMVGCGQQQETGKPAASPTKEERTTSADEQLRRAYQGACTRVRTYDEIKRGVPCK